MPRPAQIEQAVLALAEDRQAGPVLVCCALGLARSALVAAAYLWRSGAASSAAEAVAEVQRARPAVVLGRAHIDLLCRWQQQYPGRETTGGAA
jgi:protein-tyrosine phosphatase